MTKVTSELKKISDSIKKKGHSTLASEIDFIIMKHSRGEGILSKLKNAKEEDFEIPESEYNDIMEAFASMEESLSKVGSRKFKNKK